MDKKFSLTRDFLGHKRVKEDQVKVGRGKSEQVNFKQVKSGLMVSDQVKLGMVGSGQVGMVILEWLF